MNNVLPSMNRLPRIVGALLGAAGLLAASQADAGTIFSNDFSVGIGPAEALIGNFAVADGYLGHHASYGNNEYSSYRIVLDVHGLTGAFLDFDVVVQTERNYDMLQVLGNDVVLAGYTGMGGGHAHLALDALTDPDVIGRSMISFDFMSDPTIIDAGVRIDNVVISAADATPLTSVPEPSSWALTVVDLGMVGLFRRTRPRPHT